MARAVISDPGYQAGVLTIWALVLIGIAVSLRWFVLRRDKQPIKGRGFWFIVTIQCICVLHATFVAVQYMLAPSGYTCNVVFWYTTIVTALYGWMYIARSWRLFFSIKLAEEISNGQIPRLKNTPTNHSRRISVNSRPDGATSRPGSPPLPSRSNVNPEDIIDLTPSLQAKALAASNTLSEAAMLEGSPRQPASTSGGLDVKQQNLMNSALSINVSIPEQTAGDTAPSAEVPSSDSPFHLRAAVPATQGVSPSSTSSQRSFSDEDSQARLLSSSPVPTSTSPTAANKGETDAAGVNPYEYHVQPRLPTHVEEEDVVSRSRAASVESSNKGHIVSDLAAAARSVVFANYENSVLSKGSDHTHQKAVSDPSGKELQAHLPKGWFMEHRRLNSDFAIAVLFLVGVAVSIIIAGIVVATTAAPIDEFGQCQLTGRASYVGILTAVILLLLSPMFIFFIPRTDGFSIIREFAMAFTGVFVGSTLLVLSRLQKLNHFAVEVFPLEDAAMFVVAISLWLSSLVYPLYRSYVLDDNIKQEVRDGGDFVPLSALLEDAEGLEMFAHHLQAEFSLENLVFWECVEDFRAITKDAADPTVRYRLALRVFESCIRARSLFEVNLPAMIRKNIIEDLFPYGQVGHTPRGSHAVRLTPRSGSQPGKPPALTAAEQVEFSRVIQVNGGAAAIEPGFFDAAQRSVFQLMNNDSFVRFRHTTAYKDYVKRYKTRPQPGVLQNIHSLFAEHPSDDLNAFRRQRSSSAAASWGVEPGHSSSQLLQVQQGSSNSQLIPITQNSASLLATPNNGSFHSVPDARSRPTTPVPDVARPEMSGHRNLTASISSGRVSLLHNVPSTLPSRSWERPRG